MASRSKNVNGIIYRTFNSGVSDKIINLISTEGKKVTCLAKGTKKQNSRKSYSIEIGNLVKLQVIEGYALPLLTDVIPERENLHWKNTLKKITSLQLLCEIIDNFTYDESYQPEVFELFKEVLSNDSENISFKLSYFILKILKISGNFPEIDKYNDNEAEILNGEAYFDNEVIGYVSNGFSNNTTLVNPLIYKVQKYILQNNLKSSGRITLCDELSLSMLRIHLSWLNQVIGKKLKTLDLLMKVI